MKKASIAIVLILAVVLVVGTACGGNGNGDYPWTSMHAHSPYDTHIPLASLVEVVFDMGKDYSINEVQERFTVLLTNDLGEEYSPYRWARGEGYTSEMSNAQGEILHSWHADYCWSCTFQVDSQSNHFTLSLYDGTGLTTVDIGNPLETRVIIE